MTLSLSSTARRLRRVALAGVLGCMASPSHARSAIALYQDWSGQVEIKIWACDWPPAPSHYDLVFCKPDEGYVVVGGGAQVERTAGNGGLLTTSAPSGDMTAWMVGSKDQLVPFPHKRRAYVIGMRLKTVSGTWMSVEDMRSQMYMVGKRSCWEDSCAASIPRATVDISDDGWPWQPGDIMVGGGALAFDAGGPLEWSGAGLLLWQSMPLSQGTATPTAWVAQAKDHGIVDRGFIDAIAIGLRRCPDNFDGCLESGYMFWNGFVNSSGYASNSVSIGDRSWAMTSVGAEDQWPLGDYVGRLLTDIIPTAGSLGHGGVLAYSKDHVYTDRQGNLAVYLMAVRKKR